MKFPKLKHSILCQLLLYLPGLALFLWAIAAALIPGQWKDNSPLFVASLLLFGGLSLWYLFHNFFLLMVSDALFTAIRQWQKDRMEYRTARNGLGKEQIEKSIRRRCALWGRKSDPKTGNFTEIEVYTRQKVSWTTFWSAIDLRVAVCTADTLTAELYCTLTDKARALIASVPKGKPRLVSKEARKAPRCGAGVILILADTVDDDVKALARKPLCKTEKLCILPCVVQCRDGRYYVNCRSEHYEQGMTARPAVNRAAALLRRLVFARRLPKENALTQPERDFVYDPEMSLWEYLRGFRNEMKEGDDEAAGDRLHAFRRMHSGETRVGDGVVWYKKDGQLAECAFLPDEEDDRLVTLIFDETWYYCRKKSDSPFSRVKKLNRRRMKKTEQEPVLRCLEAALTTEGYRIKRDL